MVEKQIHQQKLLKEKSMGEGKQNEQDVS